MVLLLLLLLFLLLLLLLLFLLLLLLLLLMPSCSWAFLPVASVGAGAACSWGCVRPLYSLLLCGLIEHTCSILMLGLLFLYLVVCPFLFLFMFFCKALLCVLWLVQPFLSPCCTRSHFLCLCCQYSFPFSLLDILPSALLYFLPFPWFYFPCILSCSNIHMCRSSFTMCWNAGRFLLLVSPVDGCGGLVRWCCVVVSNSQLENDSLKLLLSHVGLSSFVGRPLLFDLCWFDLLLRCLHVASPISWILSRALSLQLLSSRPQVCI